MKELQDIFTTQLRFQKKVGKPFTKITTKDIREKEKLSDLFVLSLIDEAIEFRNQYNKKAWVKKRFKVNKEELIEELVDMYLFLINLTILWDLTPSELIKVVKNKQLKNIKRLHE
jgi:NTP pyrophosphatase (non-canonical NTP hydrolase)